MTLLQVEINRIDAAFDAPWSAWQQEQGWVPITTLQAIAPLDDHLPHLLYEYCPQVTLRAMRAITLASRAASMFAHLQREAGARHQAETAPPARATSRDAADLELGCGWLQTFARDQLAQAIPAEALFWTQFGPAYARARAAFADERGLLAGVAWPYAEERFLALTRAKTDLAGLTAEAFAHLGKQRDWVAPVRESQAYLAAGLQIYHDVVHWKTDFEDGRLSYVLLGLLREPGGLEIAADRADRRQQTPQVGSRFWYTGFAERLLQQAADYLCRALAAVTDLPPTTWGAALVEIVERNDQLRRDVAAIRRRTIAGRRAARRSPLQSESGAVLPSAAVVESAIAAARRYLAQAQSTRGSWGDFMLLGEQSTFWVTGYVGWTLAQQPSRSCDLDRTAAWLLGQQAAAGGWGYNRHWPVDVDSTANVLLFLTAHAGARPDRWGRSLELLLSTQRPDGGFTTIIDPQAWLARFRAPRTTLDGWTASHPCVSATVALLLARLYQDSAPPALGAVVEYLLRNQRPEGYWEAYWWTSRLYTTTRVVQVLSLLGESPTTPALARASGWLRTAQRPDGGWAATAAGPTGQAFHTALAVQALAELDAPAASTSLARGVAWLLARQLPDGAWPVTPILRVPTPDTRHPWEQDSWRESIMGLGIVVPDWQKLFTTATALQALGRGRHVVARYEGG
jgi:squalene-hopene/tetraprenyl-beta-curcumene cyclase